MWVHDLHVVMQDPTTLTTGAANGYVGGQIFYDAFMVGTPSPAKWLHVNKQLYEANDVREAT